MGQTTSRIRRRTATIPDPFQALVATARTLHGPGGCPWDRAQTVRSLLPHLVEETWEVFCAVRRRRNRELEEELGDVLYTVLFLTLLAERRRHFTLAGLLRKTNQKMRRRHPHVFGDRHARTAGEAYQQWEDVKRTERKRQPSPSKRLRPLMVALWGHLAAHPEAADALEALLRRAGVTVESSPKISAAPRRPSGSRVPA